jgi:hypothetical protein
MTTTIPNTTTNLNTTTPTAELVDAYVQMWRATEADQRAALVDRVFVPSGRHVDPAADAVGHDELTAMLAHVHDAYPGFTIERTSGIDQHGDQLRFAWEFRAADGTLVAGVDVGELAGDGRFARVAGFWGDLPSR